MGCVKRINSRFISSDHRLLKDDHRPIFHLYLPMKQIAERTATSMWGSYNVHRIAFERWCDMTRHMRDDQLQGRLYLSYKQSGGL